MTFRTGAEAAKLWRMNILPSKVQLVIGLVIVGGAAALKALVPIEPTWTWLLTAGQILSALGLYFTVPGTTAQQVAHANAAPSPVVVK